MRLLFRPLLLLGAVAFASHVHAQTPLITLQPTNTHAAVGNVISFVVTATGAAPLGYQWSFNGTPLSDGGRFSGTASNVMTIVSVRTNDAGNYSVAVSNPYGSASSQAAALVVHQFTASPAGEVALWSAEGNANDSVGGNNGTAYGVSYAPGWVGQAFQFDAASYEFIQVAPSPVVDLSQMAAWTVAAWINPTGNNYGGGLTVYSEGQLYASLGVDIYYWTANSTINNSNLVSSVPIPTNQWTHVALVNTGTNRIFYVNGARAGGGGNPLWAPVADFAYLGGVPGLSQYFDGLMDEVTIYSRALSDAEVQQVYWPGSSNLPPIILTQPASQTVYAGDSTALTVGVVGTTPLVYLWQKNGANLADGPRVSGSQTPQLSLTGLQPSDAGNYLVWITNLAGSATSQVAVVTLAVHPPVITQPPQSLTVTQGNTASFSVAAASAVPLSYRWLFQGTPLTNGGQFSGVTTTNLVVANVMATNAGNYTVAVSNAGGTTVSSPAALIVQTFPPVITGPPQGRTVGSGATVSFTVTATGQPPLSYQWRFNGANLANGGPFSGVATSNLTLVNVQTNNSGSYAVVITNVYGAITSAPVGLVVTPGPVITQQPVSQTANVGDTVAFTVQAGGTPPLSYQWRWNGQSLARATNSALTLTNVTLASAGFYDVIVSNATGFATSTPASLSFIDLKMFAGVIITGPVGATYRIDFTPAVADPPNWQTLATVTLPTTPYYFIDYTSPSVGQRFYRAVPQP